MKFNILTGVNADIGQLGAFNDAMSKTGRTVVSLSKDGNSVVGSGTLSRLSSKLTRSAAEIESHNRVRQELLLRLGRAYGAKDNQMATIDENGVASFKADFLNELKAKLGDTLKLDDFGIDTKKGGVVSSGKPLSERRITAIAGKLGRAESKEPISNSTSEYRSKSSFLHYFDEGMGVKPLIDLVNRSGGRGGTGNWLDVGEFEVYNAADDSANHTYELKRPENGTADMAIWKRRKAASEAIVTFFEKTKIELSKMLTKGQTDFSLDAFAVEKEKQFRSLLVKCGVMKKDVADRWSLSHQVVFSDDFFDDFSDSESEI